MSADLWCYLGRVFFSAFDLFTFQVGWVERSDTQHIEAFSDQTRETSFTPGLSRVIGARV